jgi:hypothetical protein
MEGIVGKGEGGERREEGKGEGRRRVEGREGGEGKWKGGTGKIKKPVGYEN